MERVTLKKLAATLWTVVFMASLVIRLPLDARVTAEHAPSNDGGWRQEGDMRCTVMAACRQWEACLSRQGWTAADRFAMKNGRYVSVWHHDGMALTLLIWEKSIGHSGFMWGTASLNKGN